MKPMMVQVSPPSTVCRMAPEGFEKPVAKPSVAETKSNISKLRTSAGMLLASVQFWPPSVVRYR